jgi:hypothetical protein
MKILQDKDFNVRPDLGMTLSRLKRRKNKEYILHFRCKESKMSYTVGINTDLTVWGRVYNDAVPICSDRKESLPTFKVAYKVFLDACHECMRRVERDSLKYT